MQSIPGVRDVGAHVGRAITGDQIVGINASQIWVSLDPEADYEKTTAKMIAKPRVITVSTEPPGATISIDGADTGKVTPAEITLTAAQAGRALVHVTLRHAGYRAVDTTVVELGVVTDVRSTPLSLYGPLYFAAFPASKFWK